MNQYQEEHDRALSTIKFVTGWLSGEKEEFCFDQEPARRYSIGIISPLSEDETNLSEEKQKSLLKRRPESIGFEARIIPNTSEITVKVSIKLSIYFRVFPTYEEQISNIDIKENAFKDSINSQVKVHFRQKYKKENLVLDNLELKINLPTDKSIEEIDCNLISNKINESLNLIAEKIQSSDDCWIKEEQESTLPFNSLESKDHYKANLPHGEKEKPTWRAKLTAKVWPAEKNQWRLNILLANITEADKSQYQMGFFNTKISCELVNAKYTSVQFEAAKKDYRYSTESWGKGFNSVLKINSDQNIAYTETIPVYEQERTITRSTMDNACDFDRLSSDEYLIALSEVEQWLKDYLNNWEKENNDFQNDRSYKARSASAEDFKLELNRFQLGMAALKADTRLEQAFKYMNGAFAKGKHEGYKGWRLFQLVFIVTQMSSLVAREVEDQKFRDELNKVDVLWFPTGGGKTEAYFGVIIAAMFYDRLRGKTRGVTAWLRYPLRMLSIQQLQRLVDIVVLAEEVRVNSSNKELLVCDPFTVGYYVGAANTPNELTYHKNSRYPDPIIAVKEEVDKASNINDVRALVLQRCPHCKSTNIKVEVNLQEIRIKHLCKDCGKEAPIYISDSEIYRYAPSVIVGTVDRLARAGQKSSFSHIFGRFTHKCPDHGYLSFGTCIEPKCSVKPNTFTKLETIKDPAPSLLLQDELHLLKESLGTYDSHFETFLDLLAKRTGSGLPPKRLAATATIEGYREHTWELYGREGIRFPVKGMGENDSAYVQLSESARVARIYVGIMPTGANPEETVATILRTTKSYSYDESEKKSWSKNIVDNYDLNLAYVNQKNTAGNIRARWEELNDIQVLTGDKGLGEVRGVIGRVESDEKKDYADRLRAIVATSVISHGVDLSRLNCMSFCGMPNHAADYIQASSRVGRSHIGIVFTVFRPDNNRERNIYQRFYEYHERLYQLVQPIPINRFSQSSIERTLSGILSACILNILSYEKSDQTRVPFDYAPNFVTALSNGIVTDDELIDLVKSAYLFEELNLPGSTIAFFEKLISKLIRDQRRIIREGEHAKTFMRMVPPPVSSLREVSEQIEFSITSRQEDLLNKIILGKRG